MYLEKLELYNFRNYENALLDFSAKINVLLGQNAQGKTNLLEAIYVLALTRSHRTSNDKELLRFGSDHAQLKGILQKKTGNLPLELSITKNGKKGRVNHLDLSRLSNYVGKCNVILFAPEDLALVKGSPAVRRRFIDMEFGQIAPSYLYELSQYRNVLKQRNLYLKQLQTKQANDKLYLQILSEQLAQHGGKIIAKRMAFLAQLEKYATDLHAQITQGKEKLTLHYQTTLKDIGQLDASQISQQLQEKYAQIEAKEIFQGTTLVGPHRDDVSFFINQKDVQVYGSQGQQRTVALSVKLAEIEVMHEKTGEYPILLLDDVLSELDGNRQTHLLKAIQDKVQTFLTTPALNDVAKQLINEPKIFKINNGQITPKTTAQQEIKEEI